MGILRALHGSTGFLGLTQPVHHGIVRTWSGKRGPDNLSALRPRHTKSAMGGLVRGRLKWEPFVWWMRDGSLIISSVGWRQDKRSGVGGHWLADPGYVPITPLWFQELRKAEPQALFDHGIHSFPTAFTLIDGCISWLETYKWNWAMWPGLLVIHLARLFVRVQDAGLTKPMISMHAMVMAARSAVQLRLPLRSNKPIHYRTNEKARNTGWATSTH